MREGDKSQTPFFFKIALSENKAHGLQLTFNILRQLSTWHTIKVNCIKFRILIQRFAQF